MSTSPRNTSGYRGVSWNKTIGKWWARITLNGKRIHLGYFDDVDEAGNACKEFAIKNDLQNYLRSNISRSEYDRYYYSQNREKMREKAKTYRKKNNDKLREWHRGYYQRNKEIKHDYIKQCHRKLKKEVFSHYGGKCECCGESNEFFLTLDHINNDGYTHRKTTNNKSSGNMYKYVKRNNFPDTFRILCWNCNCGRAQTEEKICPHKMVN
jgi:hypothetical protein